MGNNYSGKVVGKQSINNSHPFQQGGVIVEQAPNVDFEKTNLKNRRYIQNSFKMEEKDYDSWRSNVQKAVGTPYSNFAYLPTDMGFVPNDGTLASDGYAVVTP